MSDPFRFLCAQWAIGFEKSLPFRPNQGHRYIHPSLIDKNVDELSRSYPQREGVRLTYSDLSLDGLARLKRLNSPLVLRRRSKPQQHRQHRRSNGVPDDCALHSSIFPV